MKGACFQNLTNGLFDEMVYDFYSHKQCLRPLRYSAPLCNAFNEKSRQLRIFIMEGTSAKLKFKNFFFHSSFGFGAVLIKIPKIYFFQRFFFFGPHLFPGTRFGWGSVPSEKTSWQSAFIALYAADFSKQRHHAISEGT